MSGGKLDSLDIQAQNEWLRNVNSKLVVMIKNAADVLDEYARNLDQILVALKETQTIYSRLHTDLREALDEPHNSTSSGFHEPNSGDVSPGGRESDLSDRSSDPNPFEYGDSSS